MSRRVPGLAVAVMAALLAGCTSSRPSRPPLRPGTGDTERGLASWYGAEFAGLPTASGETFRPELVSAAHRTLPLGTVVDVLNEKNGRVVRTRVNDRGPFVAGRIIDLSRAAAEEIDAVADGVVPVTVTVVSVGEGRRPGTEAASAVSGRYSVQAGAFGSEANARRLLDRLAERFPSPYLEPFQGLTRVKIGPYATRDQAEEARDALAALGLAGILVPYD